MTSNVVVTEEQRLETRNLHLDFTQTRVHHLLRNRNETKEERVQIEERDDTVSAGQHSFSLHGLSLWIPIYTLYPFEHFVRRELAVSAFETSP